ncbi:MAG: AI-2E family transporter [Bacteroidetes bacterium]|nr:AI-2E family transporter [Bacteroidota bacterium]
MLRATFTEQFRQVVIFALLTALGILIFIQINFLVPGILGAITIYILNRKVLFKLVHQKRWNRYVATCLLLLVDAIVLLIPFGLAILFAVPKLQNFTHNANDLFLGIKEIIKKIDAYTGIELLSKDNLKNIPSIVSSFLPNFLNITANIFINLSTMFFILFFLLFHSNKIENTLLKFIPLRDENKKLVTSETKSIVTSYAIGIPVIAIAQGFCAYIGYKIFGISDPILWGFVTCVLSVIPFVGSSLIWIPLSVYLISNGQTESGIFLALYCIVVVLNIDNVLRLFLLKAFADIHPLITLFGVITGLKLFGFMGLIFGPLLVSYFLLMIRIYVNEFSTTAES